MSLPRSGSVKLAAVLEIAPDTPADTPVVRDPGCYSLLPSVAFGWRAATLAPCFLLAQAALKHLREGGKAGPRLGAARSGRRTHWACGNLLAAWPLPSTPLPLPKTLSDLSHSSPPLVSPPLRPNDASAVQRRPSGPFSRLMSLVHPPVSRQAQRRYIMTEERCAAPVACCVQRSSSDDLLSFPIVLFCLLSGCLLARHPVCSTACHALHPRLSSPPPLRYRGSFPPPAFPFLPGSPLQMLR